MSLIIIDPSDEALITLPWSSVIGSLGMGVVVHTVPLPLTLITQATDTVAKTSQLKLSGGVHGAVYMIEGQVLLSNGERINRQFPVRCFNS